MPSLRFDGYFILADLIGVPDLFKRIGPVLRSLVPGQPADPRIRDLKRVARLTLTTWILIVAPLLLAELALIILNAPTMARTSAESLDEQVRAFSAAFVHGDIPAGAVGVISAVLLALPIAGLSYILLVMGRKGVLAAFAACRRRPVLWLPYATTVLLVAAGLAAHWGLLPPSGRAASRPAIAAAAAGRQIEARPVAQSVAEPAARPAVTPQLASPKARPAPTAPTAPAVPTAVALAPASAHGYDPLDTSGDPDDENDSVAGYAIDQDPATSWRSQYYLGNPVFGGLKAGSGLIVDMGRKVRLSSVTVMFGTTPGADVSIRVGNDDTLAASALPSFSTVAAADGVGGQHAFHAIRSVRARYVLIWFTRLPPVSPGTYQAQIFSIVFHGSH
jgi:putative peptide zinc metalloprotease protein